MKRKRKQPKSSPTHKPIPYAPIAQRIKAFIVDMFMIMMPLLYITTYFILDGKDAYQENELAKMLVALIFGAIIVIFWTKTGQSPGMKAYHLKLIDNKTVKTPSFIANTTRYLFFMLSAISIVGLLIAFLRNDKKTLHDLLSSTTIISHN